MSNQEEAIHSLAINIKKIILDEPRPIYLDEVKKTDVKELIYILYNQHPVGDYFMFAYFDAWKEMSYADVLEILDKFVVKGTMHVFSLEPFLSFLYAYLGIDLISVYAAMPVKNKKLQFDILSLLAERPGQLFIMPDTFLHKLAKYKIEASAIKAITDKWISQGAIEAEKINPRQHAKVIDGILLYNVLGTPPKSWTWVNKLHLSKKNQSLNLR